MGRERKGGDEGRREWTEGTDEWNGERGKGFVRVEGRGRGRGQRGWADGEG